MRFRDALHILADNCYGQLPGGEDRQDQMNRQLRYIIPLALLAAVALSGCGGGSQKTLTPTPENPFSALAVGTDSTLEVMTWNLENFAKAGTVTADRVAQVIAGLDVDVVAMEEIVSASMFDRVVAALPGYDGYRAHSSYADQNLAFIFRTDGLLEVTSVYEILTQYSSALPRSPLVLEGTIGGVPYVFIANHYKCCGDGHLDLADSGDEETRRYNASLLLQQYAADHYADSRVIMLGDFNDELTDPAADNVFQNFLDVPDQWRFVDLPIAEDSSTLWSYPTWPSHIDHILINGNTFGDFDTTAGLVKVMPLHTMLDGGWTQYDAETTDHLPVVVRLQPQAHPNPFMGARLGTAGTLEVVNWNLAQFGDGVEETRLAALAIEAMDADVVALQEITSPAQFAALDQALAGYDGVLGSGAVADLNLAFLYRNDGALSDVAVTTPLAADSDLFPSPPLQLTADFQGEPVAVINVQLACCGDGTLDKTNPLDEENRRYEALLQLKQYLADDLPDVAVVLAGGFNDALDDDLADNVFLDFLVEPTLWEFADLGIASGDPAGWCLPHVPAHLDHILVSDEFYAAMAGAQYLVETVPLADYLAGGWTDYTASLSDHLPVAVRLPF